jgi:NAD-dependent deacetylase
MTESRIPSELTAALFQASHVAVLTGAGISAESGLPTFRDALTGLWANYKPEDLATPAAFSRNPKLVWDWYAMRRAALAGARPNPGHDALAELERLVPAFTLITQNVDGLHQIAGSTSSIELHGNIRLSRCFANCDPERYDAQLTGGPAESEPPTCPKCGSYLRPDVVWFGENLPPDALAKAIAAAKSCDVFISVGTSGYVQPAAGLLEVASQSHAITYVVNLDSDSVGNATYRLVGRSGVVLPEMVRALKA